MLSPSQILSQSAEILRSGSLDDKMIAVHLLGYVDDRRVYPVLADALSDEGLRPDVVLALAELRDCRATFPLINLFGLSEDRPEVQQRIIQCLYSTGDPRAAAFLDNYLSREGAAFLDIAETALSACRGNVNFPYRFSGQEDAYAQAVLKPKGISVSNACLTEARDVLKENEEGFPDRRPQTYVILKRKAMLIGGFVNEHVDVAKGRDVLAAGEVIFDERNPGEWEATYINNRSNGYYPDPVSFHWVQKFFARSDVHFGKDKFDEEFPPNGFNEPDFLSVFLFGEHYR